MVTYIDGIKVELGETVEFYCAFFPKYKEAIDMVYKAFLEFYNDPNMGMDSLIKFTPEFFESIQKQCAKSAVAMLGAEKIFDVTEEEFLEKYYYEYADYESVISPVLEAYCKIQGIQDYYAQYRRAQHENRSKWSGGGFGVKGAIKGAITASAMNLTMDYFRGFSEAKNERKDRMEIIKLKRQLYNSEMIVRYYHEAIQNMFYDSLNCVVDEFIEKGKLSKPLIEQKKIIGIFQNIVRYEDNPKEKLKAILGCIEQYPFIGMFYEEAAKYTSDPELFELAKYCGIKVIEEPDISSQENIGVKTNDNLSDMNNKHTSVTSMGNRGNDAKAELIEDEYSGDMTKESDSQYGLFHAILDVCLVIIFFLYISGCFDRFLD